MPESGDYLFTHVGFSKDEKPTLSLQRSDKIISFQPLGKIITMRFDSSVRYCTGWYDLRTGESHACPDAAVLSEKYEQCSVCQKKTGFNPAFYHATSVSSQQEERNQQPHLLYLAHFDTGVIKVGISHAARDRARLLEQGARSALILETFPTALIARQYEAKIAAMPHIVETIQLRKKLAMLLRNYNARAAADELRETRDQIEKTLHTTFSQNDVISLDPIFFPSGKPDLSKAYDCTDQQLISGDGIGMLGSILFCSQQNEVLLLPLKKFIGTTVTITDGVTPVVLPARQTSLF